MPGTEDLTTAMTNRSLRTIRTELDFLAATSALTPAQLSSILSQLPPITDLTSPLPVTQAPFSHQPPVQAQPPAHQLANTSLTEKQNSFYAPPPSHSHSHSPSLVPPPPAYASTPIPVVQPPPLATATALYAYAPTDAGDLALQPHDRVLVTEWMNADWAKGRNERSGGEGIFPRSYVSVTVLGDEKQGATGYGNGPLEVSQGGAGAVGGGAGGCGGKMGEQGKKFGKKMGNAAIFGAGATIGSNIVNSIF